MCHRILGVFSFSKRYGCLVEFFVLNNTGVGGYTYLLEPLWWVGMVTSKYNDNNSTILGHSSLLFNGLMTLVFVTFCKQ